MMRAVAAALAALLVGSAALAAGSYRVAERTDATAASSARALAILENQAARFTNRHYGQADTPATGDLAACDDASVDAMALVSAVGLYLASPADPNAISPAAAEAHAYRIATELAPTFEVTTTDAPAPTCSAGTHRAVYKVTNSDGTCGGGTGASTSWCVCDGTGTPAFTQIPSSGSAGLPNFGNEGEAGAWMNPACWSWNSPDQKGILTPLAFLAHEYAATWSTTTKNAIRDLTAKAGWTVYTVPDYTTGIGNQQLQLPMADMLTGETTCDATRWTTARDAIQAMIATTITSGEGEPIAPRYGRQHLAQLAAMRSVSDPGMRAAVEALWAYQTLLYATWTMPGNWFASPMARSDSSDDVGVQDAGLAPGGIRETHTGPVEWMLSGDPIAQSPANQSNVWRTAGFAATLRVIGYATLDQTIADTMRSRRADGTVRALHWRKASWDVRSPGAVYRTADGLGGSASVVELRTIKGGLAALGGYLGTSLFKQSVGNGVSVYCPTCEQDAAKVYHYQPFVCTSASPTTSNCDQREDGVFYDTSIDTDPDDFEGEGYDREQYLYHRTLIQLYDPTDRTSRTDGTTAINRVNEYTMLGVPKWDDADVGGTKAGTWGSGGGWRTGKVGSVYVGVKPLGTVSTVGTRTLHAYRGGSGYDVETIKLTGRSGSIYEVATTDEYQSLAAFQADLEARYLAFDAAGVNGYPTVQYDARGPDNVLHRMRLDYRPSSSAAPDYTLEARYLDGASQAIGSFVAPGPIQGAGITWNDSTKTLSFNGQSWDFDALSAAIPASPAGCP